MLLFALGLGDAPDGPMIEPSPGMLVDSGFPFPVNQETTVPLAAATETPVPVATSTPAPVITSAPPIAAETAALDAEPSITPVSSDVSASESPYPAQTAPSPTESPVQPVPGSTYTPPVISIPANVVNPYRSSYASPYGTDGRLSEERQSWSFRRVTGHQPPSSDFKHDIRQFGGYYLGDIASAAVYLTFDCGYENGFTAGILDTLKEKGVKAAFFVTKPFIEGNAELCRRMKAEGHIVGNHTDSHPDCSTLTEAEMTYEVTETARYFKEATGYDMDPFFRFPEGVYNIKSLNVVYNLGYKSIFWSMAYGDWDPANQPGEEAAFAHITEYFHNGCIMLLHAISESNALALGGAIDFIQAQGYGFLSLDSLK
ncbi:MAG: polysaccharide deacetylase family protein [Clostridiales bacterium]|nr:polysaccharide deacetylase family protein [Clostridiales bacterium]